MKYGYNDIREEAFFLVAFEDKSKVPSETHSSMNISKILQEGMEMSLAKLVLHQCYPAYTRRCPVQIVDILQAVIILSDFRHSF